MTRVQNCRSKPFAPEFTAGAGRKSNRAAADRAVAAPRAAPSSIFMRQLS
jgi:hypothetical protein